MRILTRCGCGVRALALTPPGAFGDLRTVQGFKPRFETEFWLEPVRIAGEYSHTWRRQNREKIGMIDTRWRCYGS